MATGWEICGEVFVAKLENEINTSNIDLWLAEAISEVEIGAAQHHGPCWH